MVPKAVQDAGYTAVGLGVLALQQVQVQRRGIARRASAVADGVKATAAPVGRLVEGGRSLLCRALRRA
jgi:hypothetical protein